MRALEDFWIQHERVWVTDLKQDTVLLVKSERVHWLSYQAPRSFFAFMRNLPLAIGIVAKENPDIILSTGASIAVNLAIAAKLSGKKFIFVESLSRPRKLSLSGMLVYPICDEFYVQWPEVAQRYKKAIFAGRI